MYNQIISEGFIECIDHHSTSHSGSHCITHQAVEKDFTTPIPIVFDYSCHQSSNSLCLNDCLLISSPCNGGLICLKLHCFGISTNIEKVFLHARLHPDDRNYTLFFWLSNPANPSNELFCVYHFKVVP